jgi:hypothetical protein
MRTYSVILGFVLCMVAGFIGAAEPGTSGADILKSPPGVRPAALGGAYSAFGDDVYVIGYNPAGLSRVAKYSLGVDHVQGFAEVQTQSFSLAVPTHRFGMFGLQTVYRHLPDIQNELASDPPVKAYDLVVTVANSRRFGKVSVGGALKTLFLKLAEKQAFSNAVDLGIKLQLAWNDLAVAMRNLGPAVRFEPDPGGKDPLPLSFHLGVSRPVFVKNTATLLMGLECSHVRDEGFQAAVGAEYWHKSLVALRVGYRYAQEETLSGDFSLGAGLRHSLGRLEYEVGYAWKPSRVQAGYTLNSHLFGLLFWY